MKVSQFSYLSSLPFIIVLQVNMNTMHILILYFDISISDYIVIISCVILVGLFSLQHHGTNRVAFMFAPIVAAWLVCISGIGIYNIFHWNPRIFCALSPVYMSKFLRTAGVEGWVSLGGVVLSVTGTFLKMITWLTDFLGRQSWLIKPFFSPLETLLTATLSQGWRQCLLI